ncbi:MAG TPA: hypothetical protein QF656_01880 [Nitrosopumilus sp.]|jgi:uncharacterized membrane protein|nr:hypothetical protein [Nitrosopumilus sp.]
MKSFKKKSVIIVFFLLVSILGYSQIQSASQISVNLSENTFINENKSNYKIELEFENPSFLTLPAGETKFFVFYDDEIVGKGHLESFTLYPISSSLVEGTFTTDRDSDESKSIKISGITEYDLLITTIQVPFDYYPTEEQTRKFIQ